MKENHVQFYEKHPRRYEEHSLPNDNCLEQEFENFNRDYVGNETLLGSDNNGEEEEQKTLSYEDSIHNLVVTNILLGFKEK